MTIVRAELVRNFRIFSSSPPWRRSLRPASPEIGDRQGLMPEQPSTQFDSRSGLWCARETVREFQVRFRYRDRHQTEIDRSSVLRANARHLVCDDLEEEGRDRGEQLQENEATSTSPGGPRCCEWRRGPRYVEPCADGQPSAASRRRDGHPTPPRSALVTGSRGGGGAGRRPFVADLPSSRRPPSRGPSIPRRWRVDSSWPGWPAGSTLTPKLLRGAQHIDADSPCGNPNAGFARVVCRCRRPSGVARTEALGLLQCRMRSYIWAIYSLSTSGSAKATECRTLHDRSMNVPPSPSLESSAEEVAISLPSNPIVHMRPVIDREHASSIVVLVRWPRVHLAPEAISAGSPVFSATNPRMLATS